MGKTSGQRWRQATIPGPGPLALRVGRGIEDASGPGPVLFLRLGRRRIEHASRPGAFGPSGGVTQVFGHVGHRLGRTGELASPLLAASLHVASRSVVEVARRVEIEPRVGVRPIRVRGSDALIGPVEVAARPLVNVFGPEPVGRRGQVRVRPVEPSRVAGMVDGSGQVVRRGAELASTPQVTLFPRADEPGGRGSSPGRSSR